MVIQASKKNVLICKNCNALCLNRNYDCKLHIVNRSSDKNICKSYNSCISNSDGSNSSVMRQTDES